MKIRHGLVLAIAILFGITGCASGGGGGGGGGGGTGGSILDLAGGQGERPRNTENTRIAENAIEAGDDAADDAQARMHYEAAAASARAAIAEDPTNPLAHRLAALAAMGMEDYVAAGGHFDRAAELRPVYELEDQTIREQAWIDIYNQATPLVSNGDYAGAAETLEGAAAIYKGRPEAQVTLSQLYAQLREHDKALEYMDQSMAFMDSEAMTVVDSATAAGWRESVEIIPTLRAQVFADAGRFEEASAAFRGLRATDPTNVEHTRNLAAVLMQMGDEEGALEVYRELMSQPGLSGPDLYAIGIGFYQARDYTQAAQAFAGAARVNARDRDALELWARSLVLDSAYTEVPPVARRWIELDPYGQNAHIILAQAANSLEDQATTVAAMGRANDLEVSVDQMQLRRDMQGGGTVSGSVVNKSLSEGASVTLRFTFYGTSGDPIGSVTESVTVGAQDMAQVFTVDFDSGQAVGGYGYQLTIG